MTLVANDNCQTSKIEIISFISMSFIMIKNLMKRCLIQNVKAIKNVILFDEKF